MSSQLRPVYVPALSRAEATLQAAVMEDMRGDYCSRLGAARLKRRLEKYWAERGYTVAIELVGGEAHACRTDLRSDMVNGWPPGAFA